MVSQPLPEFPLDVVVPASFSEALRGLRDNGFLGSQKYQSQQWRAVRDGAHPDILLFERTLVRRMAKLGVPIFASEVIRTAERQNDLHALGRSKAKGGQSPHQYGLAVDLVHSAKGWAMSHEQWALIGHVGKEMAVQKGLKVTWGGDWEFYDPAHWQVTFWKDVREDFPWAK